MTHDDYPLDFFWLRFSLFGSFKRLIARCLRSNWGWLGSWPWVNRHMASCAWDHSRSRHTFIIQLLFIRRSKLLQWQILSLVGKTSTILLWSVNHLSFLAFLASIRLFWAWPCCALFILCNIIWFGRELLVFVREVFLRRYFAISWA